MKKYILSTAIAVSALSLSMSSQSAYAQDIASVQTGTINKGINLLAKRIYSLEVGTLAYEMELDGVKSRDYVAVFSVDGALIQNHELADNKEGIDLIQRGSGAQILPYRVTITSDGRKLVSVGAFSLKNMNSAYDVIASPDSGKYDSKLWKIINNLDLLVYEYDESVSLNNTTIESLVFARAEAKIDLLGSSKPGHFLAIVAKGSFGFENQEISRPEGETYLVKRYERFGGSGTLGFSTKYSAGVEYNLPLNSDKKLNAKVLLDGGKTSGYPIRKQEGISNQILKEQALKTERSYMYLSPSLKYNGRLNSKLGLEVNIFGNIAIKDDFNKGGVTTDLTDFNTRPVVGAGLKLKF